MDGTKESPAANAVLAFIVGQLRQVTDTQRQAIFAHLREVFCIHCGCEQPLIPGFAYRSRCQCWNDE